MIVDEFFTLINMKLIYPLQDFSVAKNRHVLKSLNTHYLLLFFMTHYEETLVSIFKNISHLLKYK